MALFFHARACLFDTVTFPWINTFRANSPNSISWQGHGPLGPMSASCPTVLTSWAANFATVASGRAVQNAQTKPASFFFVLPPTSLVPLRWRVAEF